MRELCKIKKKSHDLPRKGVDSIIMKTRRGKKWRPTRRTRKRTVHSGKKGGTFFRGLKGGVGGRGHREGGREGNGKGEKVLGREKLEGSLKKKRLTGERVCHSHKGEELRIDSKQKKQKEGEIREGTLQGKEGARYQTVPIIREKNKEKKS